MNVKYLIIALLIGVAIGAGVTWLIMDSKKNESDFETRYLDPEKKIAIVVLRKVENAFPLFARDFKVEMDLIKAGEDKAKQMSAKGAAEGKVVKLYSDLDNLNSDVRTVVTTAYIKFVTTIGNTNSTAPEREAAGKAFDDAVKNAIALVEKVRSIRKQIDAAAINNGPADWDTLANQAAEIRSTVQK